MQFILKESSGTHITVYTCVEELVTESGITLVLDSKGNYHTKESIDIIVETKVDSTTDITVKSSTVESFKLQKCVELLKPHLTEKQLEEYIKNFDENILVIPTNAYFAVLYGFDWENSPQGYEYWRDIKNTLE